MNNPFLRFKHYKPDTEDPKENHATESLAACLAFSPALRCEFIQFLFRGNPPFEFDSSKVEVTSQLPVEKIGFIDLLLEQTGTFIVAVEVKVAAPEDLDQLEKYHTWLVTTQVCDKHSRADGHAL